MARYYPNGSNRPRNPDNPLAAGNDNNVALENNGISEWLYEDDWSKEKLNTFELLYALPGARHYFDYLLDLRGDEEYLKRYGMDYTDIHDPRNLKQTRSASAMYGYTMNFVSDNVKMLYR